MFVELTNVNSVYVHATVKAESLSKVYLRTCSQAILSTAAKRKRS